MINKFLKIYFLGAAAMMISTAPVSAKHLTPEEALSRVSKGERMPAKFQKNRSSMTLAKTIAAKDTEDAALYLFENADGNGFAILPAEDALPAVLGYADSGYISTENPSPGFEWLLSQYVLQVENAREGNLQIPTRSGEEDKAPIEPLLKSQWDQEAPYNNNAPARTATGTKRSASGCVATAMAQIMYYYKYPAVGTGTCSATWKGGTVTADLADYPFDWDNMLDKYEKGKYTDEQAKAVADLMYACGLAVKSSYASVTLTKTIYDVTALCENFGYSKGMRYYYRDYVATDEEWDNLVYGSLSRKCPVAYAGGEDDGGGHSFVCDGYDGNGYFHINWGWSGDSDGYYLLNLLNPKSQGTGGTADGYNSRQYIITDIHPAEEGDDSEYQHPIFYYRGDFVFNDGKAFNGTGKSDGKSTGFYNRSPYNAVFSWGIYIVDGEGNGRLKMKNTKEYAYSKGTTVITFENLADDLEDGVYEIYPIYYANDDQDFSYMYHETGTNDFLIFTIKDHEIVNVEPGYNSGNEPGSGVSMIAESGLRIVPDSGGNGFSVQDVTSSADVNVYSISGERVVGPLHVTEDTAVNLENVPVGIYVVTVSDRQGQQRLKIIKR